MKRYNPKEIEARWQKVWQADKTYETSEHSDKPKRYVLEYFPYPSGAAMHVGHVRNYTIGDVISRFNRMRGHNVLHPMGWDAFGLPAENYAIKTGISPSRTIQDSTKKFRQQLIQMGFDYDWSREINSSDPDYYKWTQWFFLLLLQRKLAMVVSGRQDCIGQRTGRRRQVLALWQRSREKSPAAVVLQNHRICRPFAGRP
jgi:leucyl-tRNA synthetase